MNNFILTVTLNLHSICCVNRRLRYGAVWVKTHSWLEVEEHDVSNHRIHDAIDQGLQKSKYKSISIINCRITVGGPGPTYLAQLIRRIFDGLTTQ